MSEYYKRVEQAAKEISKGPYGWIQWKGTDVCIDLHCECGVSGHVDADFAYTVRCLDCGRLYAVSPYVALVPVTAEEVANQCDPREFGGDR